MAVAQVETQCPSGFSAASIDEQELAVPTVRTVIKTQTKVLVLYVGGGKNLFWE